MENYLMELATIVMMVATSVVGYYVREQDKKQKSQDRELVRLRKEVADLKERFHHHRLFAAENFSTKQDLEKMEAQILEGLRRIEDKLDRKVDK